MTRDKTLWHMVARRLLARNSNPSNAMSFAIDKSTMVDYRESPLLRRALDLTMRLEWSKLGQFARVGRLNASTLINRILVDTELSFRSCSEAQAAPNWVNPGPAEEEVRLNQVISLRLEMGQGLGNQIWNYAILRVLAKIKGAPFAVVGEENFKGSSILALDFGEFISLLSDDRPSSPSSRMNVFREGSSIHPVYRLDVSGPDPHLLTEKPGTRIEGNFQSVSYLKGHEDWIREIISPTLPRLTLPDNVTVIHFRAGDFKGNPHFLSREYYKRAIERCLEADPNSKFLVVSDQPRVAKRMLKLPRQRLFSRGDLRLESRSTKELVAPHHFGKNLALDFNLMYSAKKLIIPNSSLSWWAAFLSLPQKDVVFAPEHWAGHNLEEPLWSTADIQTTGFSYISRSEY